MKKIIYTFFILIFIGFSSCRKKIERDVETIETFGSVYCTNGIMDSTELGVDCGGECDPCVQLEAPCTLDSNRIKYFNGSTWPTKTLINQSLTINDGFYFFKAYVNSTDYLQLTFSVKPDITYKYQGVSNSFDLGNYKVLVEFFAQYPDPDLIGSGDVYVNYENGAYTISSCDYSFHELGGPTWSTTQYFSVTFN